jgi:hypothetical protein
MDRCGRLINRNAAVPNLDAAAPDEPRYVPAISESFALCRQGGRIHTRGK